ncbi:MAG: hypothetical protein R2705_10885 [Ilumatobacteraceae bacterium]
MDRLAQMRLAHVKVDREVLFHDRAVDELRLVSSITRELTRSANKVVVEGYDGHCELSLSDVLYGVTSSSSKAGSSPWSGRCSRRCRRTSAMRPRTPSGRRPDYRCCAAS